MIIKGLQKITLLDYPGKLAATIFVAGCNFRCPFCQNKGLILPDFSENLKTYKEKEIFDFLEKRKGKLEAVCITGGEPTIYKDLPEFIKKVKAMGYLVKLDTNGTNPEMVEDLIRNHLLDYVAMDYKGPFSKYYQYTNKQISNKQINNQISKYANEKITKKLKKTIEILLKSGIDFELRTTIVPTLHTKEDLIEMAKEISILHTTCLAGGRAYYILPIKWFLQQFRPGNCLDPEFDKIRPYTIEWFKRILNDLKKYVPQTKLRGI